MRIIQTTSKWLIKELLSIDNSYEKIAYDNSPKLEDYIPDVDRTVWFILTKNNHTAGLILLHNLNNVLWMPHILIYEEYRGHGSEQWGKLVAQEMRVKYGAKKFLALTPYVTARRYAERVGFKLISTLEKSIQKNGKILNQYMLELGEQ